MNYLQREFIAPMPEPVPCPADVNRLRYRQRIEAAIEILLAELDRLDGDENLEDGADDECYITGSPTDREADHSDDEPYLACSAEGWRLDGGPAWQCDYENSGTLEGGHGL